MAARQEYLNTNWTCRTLTPPSWPPYPPPVFLGAVGHSGVSLTHHSILTSSLLNRRNDLGILRGTLTPSSWPDLYKTFVCQFRDCASFNSIICMKRLLQSPTLFFTKNIAQYMVPPRLLLLCARHHTILVMATSWYGQILTPLPPSGIPRRFWPWRGACCAWVYPNRVSVE